MTEVELAGRVLWSMGFIGGLLALLAGAGFWSGKNKRALRAYRDDDLPAVYRNGILMTPLFGTLVLVPALLGHSARLGHSGVHQSSERRWQASWVVLFRLRVRDLRPELLSSVPAAPLSETALAPRR